MRCRIVQVNSNAYKVQIFRNYILYKKWVDYGVYQGDGIYSTLYYESIDDCKMAIDRIKRPKFIERVIAEF